jgi:hypothetical protein
MQASATVATTMGWVVAPNSGVLAKDMLGFRTTRYPFFTKREIPPSVSRAFFVAVAGSPEITTISYSSLDNGKEGTPTAPKATPAAAVLRNLRRVIL